MQRYIDRPFLINRKKFDLRCWVLLAPDRRLFLYRQAVCRVASVAFSLTNLADRFTHLTNHCIQTEHPDYGSDAFVGATNELFMPSFHNYVRTISADCLSVSEHLFPQIRFLIRRSIAALDGKIGFSLKAPLPLQNLNVHCFQLLGFDFLVDDGFSCHLLEINATPASAEEKLRGLVQTMLPIAIDRLYPRSCVCHDRKPGSLSHPPSPNPVRPGSLSNPSSSSPSPTHRFPESSSSNPPSPTMDQSAHISKAPEISALSDFDELLRSFFKKRSLEDYDSYVRPKAAAASKAVLSQQEKQKLVQRTTKTAVAAAENLISGSGSPRIVSTSSASASESTRTSTFPVASSSSPKVAWLSSPSAVSARDRGNVYSPKRSPWDLQVLLFLSFYYLFLFN
jgi:hypothetical protein